MLLAQTCWAGLHHDSQLTWETQESAHFRVHFRNDEQTVADKVLGISESVYQRLTPIFNWHPLDKTDIVLSDEVDLSNGFAGPVPANRMTLFVNHPNHVNSLEDHAGWFELLISHEFVHILQLDKAKGSPNGGRNVFGRFPLLFPNLYQPAWMLEGMATYFETDKDKGIGRGQSAYFEMMMRMEVAHGIKPLRQVNQPLVTWPIGNSRYLYGVYFYQFIAFTYGEETLMKLVESYSDHLIPFRINGVYEDVLGKDLSTLWDEFETYLHTQFDSQIKVLKQQAMNAPSSSQQLTSSGDDKRSLHQAKDGRIFFVQDHLTTGSSVMMIQGNGINPVAQVIADVHAGARLDWHENSGLLVAQPELCHQANTYFDLYHMDANTGQETRLTHCQRYIFATWSPDGKHIMAVKNESGQHALHLLDAHGVLQQVLWQGSDDISLSGTDWSADGELLLSSVWRKGQGWNIEVFDIKDKSWRSITTNQAIKTDAQFVLDTHDIVFSMAYEGVYNIFQWHENDGSIDQITHVLGGAFSPMVSASSTLLSINYNAKGFDVSRENLIANSSVKPMVKMEKDENPLQPKDKTLATSISPPIVYQPWDSLKPTSWFPAFTISNQGAEVGATTFGSDVLNRHTYNLYAGYQSVSQTPVFNIDYIYDRWFPVLQLHAEKRENPYYDNQNNLVALVSVQRLDAQLVFPWLKMEDSWRSHVGLSYETSDLSWLSPSYTTNFSGYKDAVWGSALVYDSRESYGRSISDFSTGSLSSLVLETGKGLQGDYSGHAVLASWRKYFDLSHEQVFAVRADVALSNQDTRSYSLGGTINTSVTSLNIAQTITPFNKRRFALRGYNNSEVLLTGHNMALTSLEYRFPIARIERGWMAPPVGVHQVFGQVFVDTGRLGTSLQQAKTYTGFGLELGADVVLFYSLPVRLQMGYAKGLDENIGGHQAYLRLGSSF
ncbi:MAG: hypothetical protein R8M14_06535 [Ghiorsea sp.]